VAEIRHAQVAVVGAGPAGIAAAVCAAEAGAEVVLLDEAPRPGGQIWRHRRRQEVKGSARLWLERFERSGAKLLPGAEVVVAERDRLLAQLSASEQTLEVRADSLILATGARERFLPFPGWTLPNVIGVGAAQSLLKSGASFAGKRVVLAGSGPLLLPAAAALRSGGARVVFVAEQASPTAVNRFARNLLRRPGKLAEAALYRARFLSAPYRTGVWIESAGGDSRVREVTLRGASRSWTFPCDVLCCGFGLVPNVELAYLLGCVVAGDRVPVDERQETSLSGVFCAGEMTGVGGVERALVEGEIAGLSAAGREREARRLLPARARLHAFARSLEETFALRGELARLPGPETIVCRCEDVPLSRIDPSWSRRQAKLITRAGMGPCQGRVCGPALEFLFGRGTDSARPPLRPAPLSALRDLEDR
jgi:NADPH-dependent 2,4-dienoyl-CoA reductase/sulfur reductase-like enzyme